MGAGDAALGNQPIVIDNGSGLIKAGFAGGDVPQIVFPSYVGHMKHMRIMPGGEYSQGEVFVGNRVEKHRGLFRIKYAMEHGIVSDWDNMHKIWKFLYSNEHLNVASEDHPVLLTEAPLNPVENRRKSAEILFESFNVPALFVSPQAVLSLYASGRTTGIVLDVGDGVTHVVPVYESFTLPHAIVRMDVAGRDVTDHLQLLLRRSGYNFQTSAEKEVVRELKEKHCYVALDPLKEEKMEAEKFTLMLNDLINSKNKSAIESSSPSYCLPDGTVINMGPERFRAPEILFRPEIIGSECGGTSRS